MLSLLECAQGMQVFPNPGLPKPLGLTQHFHILHSFVVLTSLPCLSGPYHLSLFHPSTEKAPELGSAVVLKTGVSHCTGRCRHAYQK